MTKAPSPTLSLADDLHSVRDVIRYAVSRFNEAGLAYGHGTGDAYNEAVFMVLEALHLPIDTLDPWLDARLTRPEKDWLFELIDLRVRTRKPAPYLLNKAYIQGLSFYVDERVIVPRSFIAEILAGNNSPVENPDDVFSVLDLCTGSGCLGILAAHLYPNAHVDAVDLSPDALDVARRNVSDYGLEDRVSLYEGDLFAPLEGNKYDLIITNPPYVDQGGMDALPPEFQAEPSMALESGPDGLDHVRRILKAARSHLNPAGALICELGRCGPDLQAAYPQTPFLWLDTQESEGEVFWLSAKNLP